MGIDNFSIVWDGYFVPPCTGTYTFYTKSGMSPLTILFLSFPTLQHIPPQPSCLSFLSFIRLTLSHLFTDDGNRLYLNYQMIINDWNVHYVKEDTSATFSFTANQIYPIALEYYDATGTASVCSLPLSLSSPLSSSPSLPLHSLSLLMLSKGLPLMVQHLPCKADHSPEPALPPLNELLHHTFIYICFIINLINI